MRTRIPLRRPRWLTRPVAALVAVVIGLGGLGGAAGAALGELGGSAPSPGHAAGHHHGGHDIDDDGPRAPFAR